MEGVFNESDLVKLPLQVLSAQKKQLDQDVGFLQESLATLKMAQDKFRESKNCIEKVLKQREQPKGGTLIPITESMFVRGEIVDRDKYLVNVGTGYYLSLTAKKAVAYFERRCNYVLEQICMIEKYLTEKELSRNFIGSLIQEKIRECIKNGSADLSSAVVQRDDDIPGPSGVHLISDGY